MAKIEKMFGAILKDQEQKSDELRDKIHAENKLKKEEAEKSSEREKDEKQFADRKRSSGPADAGPELFVSVFFSVKRERACPRLHQAQRV